jgi:hypothetical protein
MKHIKTFEQKNVYFAWKSDKNGEPIDGTDREFKGESRSNVLKLLSHEEGVDYDITSTNVKCKDGNIWNVRFGYKTNESLSNDSREFDAHQVTKEMISNYRKLGYKPYIFSEDISTSEIFGLTDFISNKHTKFYQVPVYFLNEEEVKDIQKVENEVYNILVRLNNTKGKMLNLIKSTIKKKTN